LAENFCTIMQLSPRPTYKQCITRHGYSLAASRGSYTSFGLPALTPLGLTFSQVRRQKQGISPGCPFARPNQRGHLTTGINYQQEKIARNANASL
jgi:hypothetical protein